VWPRLLQAAAPQPKILEFASRSASAREAAATRSSGAQLNFSRSGAAIGNHPRAAAFRPATAYKFDAPNPGDFGAAAHQHGANLAGALDVGSAAWLQIGALNFDRGEDLPVDFFSHRRVATIRPRAVPDGDRPILEDNLICGALGAFKNFLVVFGTAQCQSCTFSLPRWKETVGRPKAF